MSLFDDLTALKQELLSIPMDLEHPDYILVTVTHDDTTATFKARITNLSFTQQNFLMASGVRANVDMISIMNIPRSISKEVLRQGIWTVSGETYRSLNLNIADSLTYRTILNKVRNR